MIYLASPYTHKDKAVMDMRARHVMQACASLFYQNVVVYSPIAHWHFIARYFELPTDYEPWLIQNRGTMTASNKLGILRLEGWEHSAGVKDEVDFANEIGRPIEAFDLIEGACVSQGLFTPAFAA